MRRILIDVDTQFDFMDPKGALYVEADRSVPEAIRTTLKGAYDAVIGSVDSHAYDAWEFTENFGPFPAHCVKGQAGWLRMNPALPNKQRFIPMTTVARPHYSRQRHRGLVYSWPSVLERNLAAPPYVLVGEDSQGAGPRRLDVQALAKEAVDGVGLYFEKEVYSLFDNPLAEPVLQQIGRLLGGDWTRIQIDVMGYAAGGYCVDAAVKVLCKTLGSQRATVRVLSYAVAAIGGSAGMAKSKATLTSMGAEWVA